MSLYMHLPTSEWRRLRLLENAVLNYGGGLTTLMGRAENQATLHQSDCPEVAALLREIAGYLHDVAIAGHLDTSDTLSLLRDK
ncbi:hypothetical protein ACU63J_22830 [Klebsiella aerogenes]